MAADNDIHPLAPAGGGGAGSFAGAGPVGMNREMDKWLSPEPLGTRRDRSSSEDKTVLRRSQNEVYLKNANVKSFLESIAEAEGGDYNLKYGGVKGKKNDKWAFSDFSTHPGVGSGGENSAAGMYQINKKTWRDECQKMGLTDFSPHSQNIFAVNILREIGALKYIINGDIPSALLPASNRWAALPQGPGRPGRYKQPYMKYEDFVATYKKHGGRME